MIRAMQRMYGADCCQNKKAEIKVFRQDVIKGGNTWIISMSESENMFWTGK